MLVYPKINQMVLIHYNKRIAPHMPLHGKVGQVVLRSAGRPRNHLVRIEGIDYVVPCGNLNKLQDSHPQTHRCPNTMELPL